MKILKNVMTYLASMVALVSLAIPLMTPIAVSAQTASSSFCYTFTKNLGEGRPISSSDANALATVLTNQGLWTSGTPITTYTDAVASAVVGFQEKYASQILAPYGLSYGTGYVGVSTRSELNSLYGCSTPTQPVQSTQCPAGYVCTPINQNSVFSCPIGYTCTPITTNPTTPIQQPTCLSGQIWNGSLCTSSNNSNQPITVTVQSPTSNNTYITGNTIPITWTSNAPSNTTVTILLERFDDKANIGSPATVKSITTTNGGSYNFTIGSGDINTLFPCPNGCNSSGSASFDVRVIIATTGTPNAQSGRFTISDSSTPTSLTKGTYINIISPAGGEFITPGSQYTIKWSTDSTYPMGVEIKEDDAPNYTSNIITFLTQNASNGSYVWNVPTNDPTSSKYKVGVYELASTAPFQSEMETDSQYFYIGNSTIIPTVNGSTGALPMQLSADGSYGYQNLYFTVQAGNTPIYISKNPSLAFHIEQNSVTVTASTTAQNPVFANGDTSGEWIVPAGNQRTFELAVNMTNDAISMFTLANQSILVDKLYYSLTPNITSTTGENSVSVDIGTSWR
jgi:hypothetical protein